MMRVPSRNEGLRPATDDQVARTARLLAELNGKSFRQLRAWAAGSRPAPDPERIRLRLLGLVERFVAKGELTPEVLKERAPEKVANRLGDEMRGPAGQEALRQIATQLAAVLLVERMPSALQEWFDRFRPRLLRATVDIVPWLFGTMAAVRASDFMASWGLAISEEHAAQIDPALRAQREAVEHGVKAFYDRLRSNAPIDISALADAALDDYEALTRGLTQIKGEVVG
jgi:hypothetical protein